MHAERKSINTVSPCLRHMLTYVISTSCNWQKDKKTAIQILQVILPTIHKCITKYSTGPTASMRSENEAAVSSVGFSSHLYPVTFEEIVHIFWMQEISRRFGVYAILALCTNSGM